MKTVKLTMAAAGVLLVIQAYAQIPSGSYYEEERQRVEAQRKQVFDPKNPATQKAKGHLPTEKDLSREMEKVERQRKELFDPANTAVTEAKPSFPNVPTPQASNINLETLAQRYSQKAEARKSEELMAFASFTMPTESIKKLIAAVNRVGGAVIFRGFKNNSLKETSEAINALGEAAGNVLINPTSFDKYKVKAVPTFVVAKPTANDQLDNDGCALPSEFISVSGDVTLAYALEEMARLSPDYSPTLKPYLRLLKVK